MVNSWLYLKSRLVGSPLADTASALRWLFLARSRSKHPELWELYLEQKRLPSVLIKLLKPDSCGLDVGCHIGSFLSLFLKYSPNGRHIAIEASPSKGRWLKQRFPSVKVLQLAVSDVHGTAIFEEDIQNSGFSHLRGSRLASGPINSYEVQVRRIDDILDGRVDFIKLDIEGGELLALRGARQIIERCKPSLLFECGSEYDQNAVHSSRHELFVFLTQCLNYQVYSFSDFLFDKGPLSYDEFRKCGLYPFRAFNFVALPSTV